MPVAAAKAEGEVHLQVDSPGSVGASLVRADGTGKTVAVRSVDLAALLHRVLRPHTPDRLSMQLSHQFPVCVEEVSVDAFHSASASSTLTRAVAACVVLGTRPQSHGRPEWVHSSNNPNMLGANDTPAGLTPARLRELKRSLQV